MNFKTFGDAYKYVNRLILDEGLVVEGTSNPLSVGSSFGKKPRPTNELLALQFTVTNPRIRSFSSEYRNLNRPFLLANFLWTLLAEKNASNILKFNQFGQSFLDQRGELNSAIGPHLFKRTGKSRMQFDMIASRLQSNPTTRRAVIQLFSKSEIENEVLDMPCFNHIQFFVREGKLCCIVVMRSQSSFMVLPYDFFLFSIIHEAMAVRINMKLGSIMYHSNSIHIYHDEFSRAEHVLNGNLYDSEDEPMKAFDNATIDELCIVFNQLSKNQEKLSSWGSELLRNSKLDDYWKGMISKYLF